MTIHGVIFDLDGTVADTLPDIAAAVNVGLESFGLPPRPTDEVRLMVGEGLPTLCRRAIEGHPHVPLEELVRRVTTHYAGHRLDQTVPFAGVPELLDGLAARGIPIAILTNKPHEHTVPMVEALFGRWRFAAVEGYRREDRRKPDPRTALEIVEAMHARPADVLMVGDSKTDMLTALNAGLVPVGVAWGYRPRAELLAAGARHLLDRPEDLLAIL
ncbi:MAG: HAD family hydrolase [Phycisphaerae bacterium]